MKRRTRSFRRGALVAEINIVPYIDVMLVLLVIFMLTAPLLQQGVTVELPNAPAQALPTQARAPIVVSVDRAGAYYLNLSEAPSVPMAPEALVLRVAAERLRDPQRTVLIKGDRQVGYGQVVGAMVLLQQAGVSNIGLVTELGADFGQERLS